METTQCDLCKQHLPVQQFKLNLGRSKKESISKTCETCMNSTRVCDVCNIEKPVSSFAKARSHGSLYVRSTCSSCKTILRKWKHKKALMDHIGQTSCNLCGETDIRVLTFHHRNSDEKSFGLAKRLNYSLDVLYEEANKCDVLCANCHIITHSPNCPDELLSNA